MLKHYPLLRSLALYQFMPFRFTLTAFLFILANVGLAIQQYSIGHAIDTLKHTDTATLFQHAISSPQNPWFWFILLCTIALLRAGIQYLAGLSALIIGQQLLTILRKRIFAQVQNLDITWHWKHGLGEVLSRTTRDSDKLKEALINFWRQVFESSLVVMVTIALLCWYHPWLGIIPLFFIVFGVAVLVRLTNQLVTLDHQVSHAYEKVSDALAEGVNGIRVIKAFGLEAKLLQRFSVLIDQFVVSSIRTIKLSARSLPIPQMIIACSYLWVIGFGAYLISQNQLQIGQYVAAILMANLLVFRIESIGQVLHIFADARSSATRIWQMLDESSAVIDGQKEHSLSSQKTINIKLEKVSLKNSETQRYLLQDCNVEFRAGEIVTVVGKTGAGKTTLMNLLNRFIDPTEGRVLIGSDQQGWQDIKDLKLEALRHFVQIIPQENFFFSGRLIDNLKVAKPDASDSEIYEALHLASATELLQRLEHGLDTIIGDKGVTLSGGQKQRIALARSILKSAPILALDDSTSALDATTEKQVLQRLISLSAQPNASKKTIIINSNKQTTIALSDRVLVLDQGKIVAQGPHAELVKQSRFYRELMGFELQTAEVSHMHSLSVSQGV